MGAKSADTLRALAIGEDTRPWEPRPARKSLGAQASWGVRFDTTEKAATFARNLAAEVESKMRGQGLRCRSISLKLWRAGRGAPPGTSKGSMGHGICDHVSRTVTLASPTSDAARIGQEAVKMLTELQVCNGTMER